MHINFDINIDTLILKINSFCVQLQNHSTGKTLILQARNQEFFRAGEVSWN